MAYQISVFRKSTGKYENTGKDIFDKEDALDLALRRELKNNDGRFVFIDFAEPTQ